MRHELYSGALKVIDVGEDPEPSSWAELPSDDRVMVGGRTVWLTPIRDPIVVPQPNRWGVVEDTFPPVSCLVEADPLVTGLLPLPEQVVGFVDRSHRPIQPPPTSRRGADLMERARRFGGTLAQIPGVKVAAEPYARTIPLVTPMDGSDLAQACRGMGVVGIRVLAGTAGGVALTLHLDHDNSHLATVAAALRAAVTSG